MPRLMLARTAPPRSMLPTSTLPRSMRRVRWGLASLGAVSLVLGLAGCIGDTIPTFEPTTDAAKLYMRLALNYRAINLSPIPSYDTFQLTATPLDGAGTPIPDLPAPTFLSRDTTKLLVSASGMLTALAPGAVYVVADLAAPGNRRHTDSALVNINVTTDPPPQLATLTIRPAPPDSTILSVPGLLGDLRTVVWLRNTLYSGWTGQILPSLNLYRRALTAGGDSIPNLVVEYQSLDPAVASVDTTDQEPGLITPHTAGQVRFVARTVAYGIAKEDTTVFTVTPPAAQSIVIKNYGAGQSIFGPGVYIRTNGIVFWVNKLSRVDIVFDDSTAPSMPPSSICDKTLVAPPKPAPNACAANFVIESADYRIRQFLVPGTYTYRDTLSGAVGKIIVVPPVPSGS